MARAIAPGSRVVRLKRLKGGLGASTHRVRLELRNGGTQDVVLKRFRTSEVPPVRREWQKTMFAQRLAVPTPDPIAFDSGDWFGTPSYVVSALDGGPELHDLSYEQIVETILAISSAAPSRVPAAVQHGGIDIREWVPREDQVRTPLVERAVDALQGLLPKAAKEHRVVSHGDFHPGNMLWRKGEFSGLIDWLSCGMHYRTREVVYCRTELAILFGAREADRFLKVYESMAGTTLEHVPTWDLLQGLTAMRWVTWWCYAYREQGRTDLTDELGIRRAKRVVERALMALRA